MGNASTDLKRWPPKFLAHAAAYLSRGREPNQLETIVDWFERLQREGEISMQMPRGELALDAETLYFLQSPCVDILVEPDVACDGGTMWWRLSVSGHVPAHSLGGMVPCGSPARWSGVWRF